MIIKYNFNDGTHTEVEVDDSIGSFINDSRRIEENAARKERYHCTSLDNFVYENAVIATPDFSEALFDNMPTEEDGVERLFSLLANTQQKSLLRKAFFHLTKTQQRRLIMHLKGSTMQEIANMEGCSKQAISESVFAGKKKFIANFVIPGKHKRK